jgi:hypothetical protein
MVIKPQFDNKIIIIFCAVGGLVYGLLMGTAINNIGAGIAAGIIFGAIFAIVFNLLIKVVLNKAYEKMEKMFDPLRKDMHYLRTIICEGPVSYKDSSIVFGGWMFLSTDAIEFYSIKGNNNVKNIPILLDDIISASTNKCNLIIETKETTYTFIISNRIKDWENCIKNEI